MEFILGPAGSGKTQLCLAQLREALLAVPGGRPLLLIAPRQSTYLLERQLLGLGVPGFTRLEILSFDRLARRVLEGLNQPVRDLLSEEGRVMVLRALLLQLEKQLKAFHRSGRAAGFAGQLSGVLRELQRGNAGVARLRQLNVSGAPALLADKLHDLALLLEAYRAWLKEHQLHDPDELLIRAAEALAAAKNETRPVLEFGGLWMDGFAEMTLPEINLLAALLPRCQSATLAFCLNTTTGGVDDPLWGVNAATFQRCRERISQMQLAHKIISLPLDSGLLPRFQSFPALGALAAGWAGSAKPAEGPLEGLNFVECADPEAEALVAARLINEHVRNGGRYREVSVMVRRMDGYAAVLQRVFQRHDIPFFADHRETMAHHPLAELTRSVLRLAAQNARHEDWLGALKTGLVVDNTRMVDGIENAALANGIRGSEWLDLEKYRQTTRLTPDAVALLAEPVRAFQNFLKVAASPLAGAALATALGELWLELGVPDTLEKWQAEVGQMSLPPAYRAIHRTAWEQMENWRANLSRAFAATTLAAGEWLSIVESGLAGMTLGMIPPALDQVFVGAVDRSRQAEVKLAIVLGLNGGVFPAAPAAPPLLNRAERIILQSEKDLGLSWDTAQLAARESYYAYIACTRPSQRLCATWSRRGSDGKALLRSAVAERLLAFAGLKANAEPVAGDVTRFDGRLKMFDGNFSPETVASLPELLECQGWDRWLPAGLEQEGRAGLGAKTCGQLREELLPAAGESERRLGTAALAKLHPEKILHSSVSGLETFARCPFRHFVNQQLRLNERDEFKADQRTIGTLLHAVLKEFHEFTLGEKKQRWRDWSPAAAAEKIRELGGALLNREQFAAQSQDELVRWESERKISGLAVAVRQMIAWFQTCGFDPVLSEFKFRDRPDADGAPPDVPAWNLSLNNGGSLKLQGSIDRVDACQLPDGRVLVAVFDYKTGGKSPDKAQLQKGFELQLLGYLAFAAESAELKSKLAGRRPDLKGDAPLLPAGAFYVPLMPRLKNAPVNATDGDRQEQFLESLAHVGRADRQFLEVFDSSAQPADRAWTHSLQFKPSTQSPNFQKTDDFLEMVSAAREHLRTHAGEILSGKVGVLPARFGSQSTSCEHCPYQPVCRFEPVFGTFRPVTFQKKAKPDADEIVVVEKNRKSKAVTGKEPS